MPDTTTRPRWVEWVPLDEIIEAEDNPKGHAAAALEESFSVHGYVAPVVRDERTGRLVAGHGRLAEIRRARDAEQDPPDGVDVVDGVWLVGVWCGWRSTDDDQAAAYLLVDNVATELGGWRRPALADMVTGLRDRGRLDGTGYTRATADELLALTRVTPEPEEDPATPEPPGDPITHRGDVWLLGRHRVMCGSCRTPGDVDELFTDEGDAVYDPFTGSGSTLLAAQRTGRVGFGMEISPGYVDVICARWQRVTGIEPVLEATGETRSFTPVV